jgi:hypothetical protein
VYPSWAAISSDTAISIAETRTYNLSSLSLLFQRRRWNNSKNWNGWMPTPWLRLRAASVGGSRHGSEGGATLIFSPGWITATFTTEAGHYTGGDAFSRLRSLAKSPHLDASPLRSFNLDYQVSYFGIELNNGLVAFSINVGLTRAEYSQRNVQSIEEFSKPIAKPEESRSAQIGPAAKLALLINL